MRRRPNNGVTCRLCHVENDMLHVLFSPLLHSWPQYTFQLSWIHGNVVDRTKIDQDLLLPAGFGRSHRKSLVIFGIIHHNHGVLDSHTYQSIEELLHSLHNVVWVKHVVIIYCSFVSTFENVVCIEHQMCFGNLGSFVVRHVLQGSIFINDRSNETLSPSFVRRLHLQILLVVEVEKVVVLTLIILTDVALFHINNPSRSILVHFFCKLHVSVTLENVFGLHLVHMHAFLHSSFEPQMCKISWNRTRRGITSFLQFRWTVMKLQRSGKNIISFVTVLCRFSLLFWRTTRAYWHFLFILKLK